MIIRDWILQFETLFPTSLAEEWDNIGLQVGNVTTELTGILLTLDVTQEVIDEAIERKCNLIVAHHPLLFRPVQQIDTSSYVGRMIQTAIKQDVTIYAAHTNFDSSETGLNTILADQLQLKDHKPLQEITDMEGLGRIGVLSQQTPLEEFIVFVKKVLNIDTLKLIGNPSKMIQTVALCGGSGSSLIELALEHKADVYISGDITYHHALDAKNLGLTILDVGHNVEKEVLPTLKHQVSDFDRTLPIFVSTIDTNPYINK